MGLKLLTCWPYNWQASDSIPCEEFWVVAPSLILGDTAAPPQANCQRPQVHWYPCQSLTGLGWVLRSWWYQEIVHSYYIWMMLIVTILPDSFTFLTHHSHTLPHYDSLFPHFTPLWLTTPIVLLVYIQLDPHLYSLAWSYSSIPEF